MPERLRADTDHTLLAFLRQTLPQWSRNKLKARLTRGHVAVNGEVVTSHAHPIVAGDEITIGAEVGHLAAARGGASKSTKSQGGRTRRGPGAGIRVIYVDQAIVVLDKPVELLSVSAGRETKRTALALTRKWLGARARLWPVNRLDLETSGLILFARSHELREKLQARWLSETTKTYRAVVWGRPEQTEGRVDLPLIDHGEVKVQLGSGPGSKQAHTRYRVLKSAGQRSLLELQLETGRRHQIRAHMASLGHPVVGDTRYGAPPAARLGLHAWRLRLRHPVSDQEMGFESSIPPAFAALFRQS